MAPPAGGPAHEPPGSSSAPLCAPGHHEDKRWAGSTQGWSPTLVPRDRAPPRGGQPGQTKETGRAPQGSSTHPCCLEGVGQGLGEAGPKQAPGGAWQKARPQEWPRVQRRPALGRRGQRGQREGEVGARGLWWAVAAPSGAQAGPRTPGWGDTLVTSTLQLPEHLTPGQTHSPLTRHLKPRVNYSLTSHTSHMWRRLHSLPLDIRCPVHTRLLKVFRREVPWQRQGAAVPSREALGLLDQRLSP